MFLVTDLEPSSCDEIRQDGQFYFNSLLLLWSLIAGWNGLLLLNCSTVHVKIISNSLVNSQDERSSKVNVKSKHEFMLSSPAYHPATLWRPRAPIRTTTVSREALEYWINVCLLICCSCISVNPEGKTNVIQTYLLLSEKTVWKNSSKAKNIALYHKQKQTSDKRSWGDTHYCFNGTKWCQSVCMCWILLTLSGYQWTVQCSWSVNGWYKFDLSD